MRRDVTHCTQLPDIQINHADFVRPLQAVAQRDVPFARSLFSSLFLSVYRDIDDKMSPREAEACVRQHA